MVEAYSKHGFRYSEFFFLHALVYPLKMVQQLLDSTRMKVVNRILTLLTRKATRPSRARCSLFYLTLYVNFLNLQVIFYNVIQDPVANWELVQTLALSSHFADDFTSKACVPYALHSLISYPDNQVIDGAHWLQLDNPTEFNSILREWLAEKFPNNAAVARSRIYPRHGSESTL